MCQLATGIKAIKGIMNIIYSFAKNMTKMYYSDLKLHK